MTLSAFADEHADDTRSNILRIATQEFSAHGLAGARVDRIAERTRSTKGMIYYYFRSKEGLYIEAIENLYADMRAAEAKADLSAPCPVERLTRLVETSFDFHADNPHVARLIAIENVNDGRFIAQSAVIRELNAVAVRRLDEVLRAGIEAGLFRPELVSIDIHFLISALCVFRISNRATFQTLFDYDFAAPDIRARHRAFIVQAVLDAVGLKAG